MTPLSAFYPPATLTAADRRMLSNIVEQLIEMLDLAAGECEFEDDDPAGDPLDAGECDEGRALQQVA